MTLADCHRFPALVDQLPQLARQNDVMGFGVVNSTYLSTRELLTELAGELREAMPTVVLGGHAVTLGFPQILGDRSFGFTDYLILGDGEIPMVRLVEGLAHDAPIGAIPGVVSTRERRPAHSAIRLTAEQWDELPWLDRRLFQDPNGQRYEPTETRNHRTLEAHLVLSRGCDWHCSFCTEAILRPSGEIRRAAQDIVSEVEWLATTAAVTHVQFIDDNVFPQTAATGRRRVVKSSHEWVEKFLAGLSHVASLHQDFHWRGILRFEDFVAYEAHWRDFSTRLSRSGCHLLAFGVEYGSEDNRRRAKGGTITNAAIVKLLHRLSDAGIHTKGYFMVGGPGEDDASTDETIAFASSAGFSLAYFALYKNFRPFVHDLRRKPRPNRSVEAEAATRAKRFLEYQQLPADFERHVLDAKSHYAQLASFGRTYSRKRTKEAMQAVEELRDLGFQFTDIFKYNDFHADIDAFGDADEIWRTNDGARKESFLCAVRRAYFEFYARPAFVKVYEALIGEGY